MSLKKLYILLFIILALTQAKAQKIINIQLLWKHQFQFAGFYIAREKGYYANLGLNVKIHEWNTDANLVDDVLSGKTQYSVVRQNSLIDISKNKPIVYLATIYQTSPMVVLADKSSNIKSVKDFKNKKIMLTKNQFNDPSITSMLSSNDMKISDLVQIEHSYNVKDLLDKKTDLMISYASNEPFLLKEIGGEPVVFAPDDFGFRFYNDLIIASKEYVENNQKEAENFIAATIKGFEYAFSNIDETIEIIQKHYNTQNKSKESLKFEANELKKLAFDQYHQIGKIDKANFEKAYDIYKVLGLANGNIDFDSIVYKNLKKHLNDEEKKYLEEKKVVKICADPNWMPFDKIDENGNYIGIGSDYFKLFSQSLPVKFEALQTKTWDESIQKAKEKQCDVLSLSIEADERKSFLNFTSAYINVPIVAATKLNVPFINNIKELKNKPIGMVENFGIIEILKDMYSELNIIEVNSVEEGLEKTKNGEFFAFIDTLPTLAYELQFKHMENLKISGKLYENLGLHLGVRNDDETLLKIMQKAIDNITNEQKRDILNSWISVKYEAGVDYSLVWKIVLVVILAFIGLIYLSLKNKLLEEAERTIKEKNIELEKLATTDKLTQIYNRAKLDEILEKELRRCQRYGNTFGICILDIDFFKKINDTYGHQVGDKVLVELAKILKLSLRQTDYIGRWGGEEFLIICPETQNTGIEKAIKNIQHKIKTHYFINNIKVTISFGLTLYKNSDTRDTILQRADEALYKAKEEGRDRIVWL